MAALVATELHLAFPALVLLTRAAVVVARSPERLVLAARAAVAMAAKMAAQMLLLELPTQAVVAARHKVRQVPHRAAQQAAPA
jgi:hypothetical protein